MSTYHHHHRFPPPVPFHLLELTIISAQDLFPAARSMRPYALAWVHPDHKLSTRVDPTGHADPTWNDKFVFRVDDTFLRSDTSAVTVQIRAAIRHRPDPLVGTVRIVLSALRPSPATRFVALQVRRPSLRPQGILNIGVALLDSYIRSMPLYADLAAAAFAYKDLMVPHRSLKGHGGEKAGGEKEVVVVTPLERSGSLVLGSGTVERERKALESKLEKWRTELPSQPTQLTQDRDHQKAEQDQGSDDGRSGRRRSKLSCFCG